ncbi:MAG TPA: transglycosylase family protein [Gaiellaceae bacterium]|nr:transglycosylase family protein [Gaiellaceae bacterium]
MRSLLVAMVAAFTLAAPGNSATWDPPAAWLAQAKCVHRHEAPWSANTGNGYFGGMQFSMRTWLLVKGAKVAAFKHPGDPAFPFGATQTEQLYRAWLLWEKDGGSWRSWGAVGAACSR